MPADRVCRPGRLVRIVGGLFAGLVVLGGCSGAVDGTAAKGNPSADSSATVYPEFNDADADAALHRG